jgi:hypothetical protein
MTLDQLQKLCKICMVSGAFLSSLMYMHSFGFFTIYSTHISDFRPKDLTGIIRGANFPLGNSKAGFIFTS